MIEKVAAIAGLGLPDIRLKIRDFFVILGSFFGYSEYRITIYKKFGLERFFFLFKPMIIALGATCATCTKFMVLFAP